MRKVLASLLIAASLALTGCGLLAAAVPALTNIAAVIADASATLNNIDAGVRQWIRMTDPPANQIAKYESIRGKAYRALSIATRAVRGAQDVDQEQYEAAFHEFKVAFGEMQAFLEETNAMSAGTLSIGGEAPEPIPEPIALSFKVQ